MAEVNINNANIGRIRLTEASTPSTPASGYGFLYEGTDKLLHFKGDDGVDQTIQQFPYWVSNHPDNYPTSPDAMDDEFEGVALDAKWTVINPSSLTATTAFGNSWINVSLPYGTQAKIYGVSQPTPVGTWKVRSRLSIESASGNYIACGLFARKASASKHVFCGIMWHTGYGYPGLYAANVTEPATVSAETNLYDWSGNMFYMELEWTGSNLIWKISSSGAENSYSRCYLTDTTFLGADPDQVGFMIHPYGALDANQGQVIGCNWFRRIA